MPRRATVLFALASVVLFASSRVAQAQVTYHLHNEASTTAGLKQLKTANPDVASVALQTANLKSTSNGEKLIKEFDTPTGVPGLAGTINSGSTLTFQLWVKKTANVGTMFPRAKVFLNNASGTALCTATGTTAITTTLTKYTISCNTSANVTLVAASRYYLWAGVNMTAGSTTTNFMAELDLEGTLNGNFDSQVAIPDPPSVTSIVPSSAGVGQSVTVNGLNFGTSGILKFFNNQTAVPTSWTSTAIQTPVPAGATTGAVTVTVGTRVSTGVSFTVLPTPTITSLSPASGSIGTPVTITGTNYGSSQGTSTVKFNGIAATSFSLWNATRIDTVVPAGATSGPVVVTVSGVPSAGSAFTVPPKLTSLTPSTAHVSDSITIAGTSFLASQGTSTVTFAGTAASPTSWTDTSIGVPVPAGATSGNVVVAVAGQASNTLPFTLIPPPTLTNVAPGTGHVADPVTVTGTNFGTTQGTSAIKFNGTTATPTTWTDTSISTPVPAGATTGNVVVTVSNQPSNGLPFTVILSGTIGGSITRVTGGTGISGATVQAVQSGVVKGSATTSGTGGYSITPLEPGTYDVRIVATGFSSELRQGQTVVGGATTTLNVAMYVPGSVGGRVTKADGITPLSGAAVTVYSGPLQRGTTNTNATGDYTIGALHPGAFTVQAANAGYTTNEQGATVTENATTTQNFALQGAPANPVQYAYDELNRLVQVTDPSSQSAIYRYDAVGNILAIERPGTTSVAISAFTPSSGPVGTVVTIYGAGFSTTPASNTVTFNGVVASVTAATATQLTVTVPSGATTGAIGVSNTLGAATSTGTYTVLPPGGGAPTISGFSPTLGVAGTSVTINGTNFDTVLTRDRTTFNTTLATVTAATSTALTTTVPLFTSSGRLTIATPAGSFTTSSDFIVPPSPYTPTDVETSGRMSYGTATTVTVATANKIALELFDGTAGHRVSLLGTNGITGQIFGCDVNVATFNPNGTSLAAPVCMEGSGFIDVAVLRTSGTYTIEVDPTGTATGSVTLTLYDVPADVTGTITAGGSAVTLTTTTPGQNATLTFSGTAGHRISLLGTNGMLGQVFGCDVNVSVLKPDGTVLAPATCMEDTGFIDVTTLPATGTYTIQVDPVAHATGNLTLALYDVAADLTGTISPGGSAVTVNITSPGQNAAYTFSGTAGQRVSLVGSNGMSGQVAFTCDVNVTILKPDATVLGGPTCMESSGFIDVTTLPATGTYTIKVDPTSWAVGNLTLNLYDVPADVSGTITPGGSAVTVTTTAPGQNGVLTFSGTSGHRISIVGTNGMTGQVAFACDVNVTVLNPDASVLVPATCMEGGGFIDATSLPTTGTYTIQIDPAGVAVGSLTLALYDVPADSTGTVTIGGSAVSVSMSTPGQNGLLTFSGTASQQVTVHVTNNPWTSFLAGPTVKLLGTDGTTVLTSTSSSASSFNLSTVTLPSTGTYTVFVDVSGAQTGSLNISVSSP